MKPLKLLTIVVWPIIELVCTAFKAIFGGMKKLGQFLENSMIDIYFIVIHLLVVFFIGFLIVAVGILIFILFTGGGQPWTAMLACLLLIPYVKINRTLLIPVLGDLILGGQEMRTEMIRSQKPFFELIGLESLENKKKESPKSIFARNAQEAIESLGFESFEKMKQNKKKESE